MAKRAVNKITISLSKTVLIYKGDLNKCTIKRFLILSPSQAKAKMLFGNELKTYQNTCEIVLYWDKCQLIKRIFLGVLHS